MKRNLLVCCVAVVLLCMAGFLFSGCDVLEGADYQLEFATFWPHEDFQVAEGHKAWAEEIEKRVEEETEYTLEFNWSYGGELLGADEIYEGIADGSADIGTTCPSYTPGVFPVTEAFELPGLNNDNALVSSMVIQEAYETYPLLQEEYEDVEVMHFWATGPGDLITKERVESLEDLQGMDIRVAGGSVPVMEELGAVPVTMGMDESYTNLEQGIVEGILSPTDVLVGFQLAEVTSYITKTPYLYNITFMKVMNPDTWDNLPQEVQQIFREVNEGYTYEYGALRAEHTELGQEVGVEEYGMEIIELDPEGEERWLEEIEPIQDQWMEEAEEEGLPGEEIMDLVRELDEKYSDEYGDYDF